jgi:hypothetical protein
LMLLWRPARRTHRTSTTTTRKKKCPNDFERALGNKIERKSPFMACLYSRVVFYRRRRRIIKKIYLKLWVMKDKRRTKQWPRPTRKKKGQNRWIFCVHITVSVYLPAVHF